MIMKILVCIVIIISSISLTYPLDEKTSGDQYLLDNFRLFDEIGFILEKWAKIEDTVVEADPTEVEFSWEKTKEEAKKLLEETLEMYKNFGLDLRKIEKSLNEEELLKLRSFNRQAALYIDVVMRIAMKLPEIVDGLHNLTQDPNYTLKEQFELLDQYEKLVKEYHEEGPKFMDEFEKTKKLVIYY